MQALTSPKKGFLRLGAGRFKREESDKSDEIWKLNTKIEQLKPAQLKGEVPTLHSEWSKLAKAQAKMDQLRQAKAATLDGFQHGFRSSSSWRESIAMLILPNEPDFSIIVRCVSREGRGATSRQPSPL